MSEKGAATAAVTKLVNDSTGYSAAYASLAAVAYLMHKKGSAVSSNFFTIVCIIISLMLICYWIDHVTTVCQKMDDKLFGSKTGLFHKFAIQAIFIVGQPLIIAVTIIIVMKSIN